MSNIEWIIELREFPGYFISTRGRVFSEKGKERIELKPSKQKTGYLHVSLQKEGKGHSKHIHRLMCETFLERKEGKNQVDHINRIRNDNRLENLRWCNNRENQINTGIPSNNTSGVKGIRFRKDRNCWVGCIHIGKNKRIRKCFKKKEEAVKWRLEMEKKYYNLI